MTFDARPMIGLDLGELDLRLFEREYLPASLPADVIEEIGRTPVEQLAALRLAEAMRNLGYVQRFGAGLQIARSGLERNGNPSIDFTVDPSFIGLTLRSAS